RECTRTLGSTKEIERLESKLIRAFRRRYEGPDRDRVQDDSLYCLSLMQHHGAPTRLLDLTYSFFVAVLFALEGTHEQETELRSDAEIWCFNGDWCWKEASRIQSAARTRSHVTSDGD